MATNGGGAVKGDQTPDLQLLVHSAPTMIHTGRPDGYLDFFNQTWARYVGGPLEDLLGWKWTSFIHPEDVEAVMQKWCAALASGEPFLHEARILRADGHYRWMLLHKVGTRDESGQIIKWYGSMIDIEDRKQAEEQLRRSTQDLQKSEFYLAEGQRLAHLGSWAFDPSGFDYWSPELFRMHGLDPARTAPTVQEYLDCIHPQDRESMVNLIEGLSANALPFDAVKRIVRPDGEVRYIRCVGVPVTGSQSLKKYVGSALDVTEQELSAGEFRRREAYLAQAQQLSRTGSWGWKRATGELVWSDETYRIFGYDRRENPRLAMVFERIHPDDMELAKQVVERASLTTDFDHEYRLLMPGGAVRHIHVRGLAVSDASDDIEIIGAVTDITERKAADQALRRSEAYLAAAQRLSKTGSWVWNPASGQRYCSEESYRLLGFEPLGPPPSFESLIERIHPDDQASFREQVAEGVHGKVDFELDYRIIRADNTVGDIHCVCHPVLDQSGDLIELVSTVIDITERKAAEGKIREQEMQFRQIVDLAPHLVAVYGPNRERVYANRVMLDYIGITLGEWQKRSKFGESLHPEDWQRGTSQFNRSAFTGPGFELELRMSGRDGSYRWFLIRCNPVRDEKEQIMRWYVACTDIDDRKQAEQKLQQENVVLREEVDKASMFEEIVGTSTSLKAALSRIAKVAPTDSTVLITGETGTGKELIARAVHKRSHRSGSPFISVNCAALPSTLVSSELFGHEKGAFTGATQRRLGRFEMADGGTIFLDEVGELLPETQAALLRVLQEREFERVGGGQSIHTNVRVIAATNRDLNAAVENGTFRQDLLYRLNVFPIEMPALRERKDDILILAEYFVQRYASRAGKKILSIHQKTLDLLHSYDWPGNIRELQNVIERSIILSSSEIFSVDELWLSQRTPSPTLRIESSRASNDETRSEREIIEAALAETRGRVSGTFGAAVKLRVPSTTLETRIKTLKIDKRQFKFR